MNPITNARAQTSGHTSGHTSLNSAVAQEISALTVLKLMNKGTVSSARLDVEGGLAEERKEREGVRDSLNEDTGFNYWKLN